MRVRDSGYTVWQFGYQEQPFMETPPTASCDRMKIDFLLNDKEEAPQVASQFGGPRPFGCGSSAFHIPPLRCPSIPARTCEVGALSPMLRSKPLHPQPNLSKRRVLAGGSVSRQHVMKETLTPITRSRTQTCHTMQETVVKVSGILHVAPTFPPEHQQDYAEDDTHRYSRNLRERKKRRRLRNEEVFMLESVYAWNQTPDAITKLRLAHVLLMTPQQVSNWFQNKRSREKKDRFAK